jgi:hypothetical protein
LVAGNFSAFWKGLLIAGLMAASYFIAINSSLPDLMTVKLPDGGSVFGCRFLL